MLDAAAVPLTVHYAVRSDRGLRRSGNQDSAYAGPGLLAVADGMGGMAAGDRASALVIDELTALGTGPDAASGSVSRDAFAAAIDRANQRIRDEVEADNTLAGMGTTLTAFAFAGDRVTLAHIGDSRAYLLRGDMLTQVTRDDTYVQMLVDEGRIEPDEASDHPQRSVIMRALQGKPVEPIFEEHDITLGDRFLLCSDGLSGVVSAETMQTVLRDEPDLARCVDRLVDLALRAGAPDNVTVIVADVTDDPDSGGGPVIVGAAAGDR
ncbi:MAG TPA: protein phosphatase 2C domain-containing protein [Micromonosporaceae bacterium]|nr:protein phosphatase 2C domain-containing protein [Micromonosporaceae bacterium]